VANVLSTSDLLGEIAQWSEAHEERVKAADRQWQRFRIAQAKVEDSRKHLTALRQQLIAAEKQEAK
jgi:hypothetical protein